MSVSMEIMEHQDASDVDPKCVACPWRHRWQVSVVNDLSLLVMMWS